MKSWKQSAARRVLRKVQECQDLKQGVGDDNGDKDELVHHDHTYLTSMSK